MYEIVPGFAANLLTITLINAFSPQQDEVILTRFDEMRRNVKNGY
jgi:sodium/proline symporter